MAGKPITNRIGETNIAKNGLKMTIIAYRGNRDIDILFEDGTIVTNKSYQSFKEGTVAHPNINTFQEKLNKQKTNRIGETNIAKNGLKMTIIAYRSSTDIDIRFEDGIIVTNKSYQSFKKGNIAHPQINMNTFQKKSNKQKTNRIGETNIAKNGLKMTIIAYRTSDDIDIQFEDGIIVTNKSYYDFKRGQIGHPNINIALTYATNKYIGETNIMYNGLKATIKVYRGCNDIDVEFEDGITVTNKTYDSFKKGHIAHPSLNIFSKIGETNIAKNGLKMTITEYHDANNIDIQFEDGFTATNKRYQSFKNGTIKHPFPYQMDNNVIIEKSAYVHNNVGNFYCHCNKCKQHNIMTVAEMKEHKCSA